MNEPGVCRVVSALTTGRRSAVVIALFPWLLVAISVGLFVPGRTRWIYVWLVLENHPVELATFVCAVVASIAAYITAYRLRANSHRMLHRAFFLLFAFVVFFLAMEEVAWGQKFFAFETPHAIKIHNAQGELTLHNLAPIQHHNEWLRLLFAITVGIGILFNRVEKLADIAVPKVYGSWALLIAAHAAVDIYNDHFPIGEPVDMTVRYLSEVFELLIAALGLLYIISKCTLATRRRD